MSMRTPFSQARGLGSAHDGTDHFWWQRVTGFASLFLTLYLIYMVIALAGADYGAMLAFFASPINATLTILLIIFGTYHMHIGMQVILEDYVQNKAALILGLMFNLFFSAVVALMAVLAVLKLSLGA